MLTETVAPGAPAVSTEWNDVEPMTETPTGTSKSGKVKKTRRRQRLSCVECTRKRTKCDRQLPCGTCVSRGIASLCRWEPLAPRPTSQHPPDAARESTIAALSARIAVLEQTILRQNLLHSETSSSDIPPLGEAPVVSAHSDYAVGSNPHYTISERQPIAAIAAFTTDDHAAPSNAHNGIAGDLGGACALSRIDFDVQLAAISMAQLSLAPQDEYIGGGTVVCALHKLGDPYRFRYPFAPSADSTTINNGERQPGSHPLSAPIQRLVSSLPAREKAGALISGYFAERNWEFGIPERWFRRSCERMWQHLDLRCPGASCYISGGCTRCTQELNLHWLTLLFAVLALAPHRVARSDSRVYFLRAMEARRLVEDVLFASRPYSQSSAANGLTLSCVGAVLLAKYLADRGRVSDAWKLIGAAVRNAQSVGLHRDPGWQKWEEMDKQERELRILAWWTLVIADRLYSFILGRPMMTIEGTYDVKLLPDEIHADDTPSPFAAYHKALISLFDLIGETMQKCLGMYMPAYASVLDMDRKYKLWLLDLHPSLDWRRAHRTPSTPQERALAYQRHLCAAYYLGALMNLHRPYLMHTPPILPPPKALSAIMTVVMNPSRERCIETAMELVRVMCDAKREADAWDPQLSATLFHYTYAPFDGAVAVMGALSQNPPHPKVEECLALIDRATAVLRGCAETIEGMTGGDTGGDGNTASRAVHVLDGLRKAGRWEERFQEANRLSAQSAQHPTNAVQEPPHCEPSHASGTFSPLTSSSGNPTHAAGAHRYTGTSQAAPGITPIPFLSDVVGTAPGQFPRSGPSTAPMTMSDALFTSTRDLGSSWPRTAPDLTFGLSRGDEQGLSIPLDMLQQDAPGANDVDWSMFNEMQGWPVGGPFGAS